MLLLFQLGQLNDHLRRDEVVLSVYCACLS